MRSSSAQDAFAEPGTARTRDGRPTTAKGEVAILFLSDGRQNRGLLPPRDGASLAAAAGIPVFTVALGTDRPGRGRRERVGYGGLQPGA